MQGTTIKLASFVGLSVMVHGLVLLINEQYVSRTIHTPIGNQILSVSLAVNDSTATGNTLNNIYANTDALKAEGKKQETVQKTQHDTSKNWGRIVSTANPQVEPASSINKTTTTNKSYTSTTRPTLQTVVTDSNIQPTPGSYEESLYSAQRNFLLGEIYNRLSQYMNYPTRARRRGWEGSVMIGFNVDKKGFLRNIHLTQTSGYTLLDNAALTAIKKVNYIPVSQWGSVFQPIALKLPVVYRLTNS